MTSRLTRRGCILRDTAMAILVLVCITPGAIAVALYLTGGINP